MSYLTGIEKASPPPFFFFSFLSHSSVSWTKLDFFSFPFTVLFTCLFDFNFSSQSYLGYVQGWQVQHESGVRSPKLSIAQALV